ncbi:MAG: hypothetical protein ABI877_16300, partial [Gemmatimonadaceae bacterium]
LTIHIPAMRSLLSSVLVPCLAFTAAGCAVDASSPVAPNAIQSGGAFPAVGVPGCLFPVMTSGVLEPINANGASVFELRRTIPVKIRATDCVTLQDVNALQPQVSLAQVGLDVDRPVNELVSSSAADDGTTMRNAGNGQYIFNLSTKNSQFNGGLDLVPGVYQLTISSPNVFADVVVQFTLRR